MSAPPQRPAAAAPRVGFAGSPPHALRLLGLVALIPAAACDPAPTADRPAPDAAAAAPAELPTADGRLVATDLGVGSVVRLTLEPSPAVPAPDRVLVLRREDGVPRGPRDARAARVFRGPPQPEYFDADTAPGRDYHYAAVLYDGNRRRAAVLVAHVHVGPLPVTQLAVSDPGVGRRLDLTWSGSRTGTMDRVRILRFVGRCDDEPDPAHFDRRVDLPVAGPGRPQAWSDDEVVDGLTYCYALFTRSSANYLYSPGAFASGRPTDATPPAAVAHFAAAPSAAPGDRAVELSWTNPRDADLARVVVLRRTGTPPARPDDPEARLVCEGLVERCRDTQVDDGTSYVYRAWALDRVPLASPPADARARRPFVDDDGDRYREDQGDCDDAEARAYPGAPSLDCSATDWDCDGDAWDDAYCRTAAPAWLDDQCARRSTAYACVPDAGCNWNLAPDHSPCSLVTDPDYAHDICVAGACRSPGSCGNATCNSPGPHFRLPPAAGHAGLVRTGDDEPLVADAVTALVWQGCPAGLTGRNCATGERGSFDLPEALAYCDGLTWGGRDDWRLPDRHELFSIVDHGRAGPAVDVAAFPETSGHFWSSSAFATGSLLVWVGFFDSGNVSYFPRDGRQSVRCVRGGAPTATAGAAGWRRFRRVEPVRGEPVVLDAVTGLAWQGCAVGSSGAACAAGEAAMQPWSDAVAGCDALVWAGFDDWRLPDDKELDSILDSRRRAPAIDPESFPATPVGWYWTALPYAGGPATHAWHVSFGSGHVANFDQTLPCFVRCVRRAP